VKTHALAVMPQHLDQAAAPAPEHEQMPAMRVALELLLHQQRQAIKPLAHIGVAGRQPNPRARRERNHRRRLLFASALISADTVAASTAPVIRIRPPVANSISTVPARSGAATGEGRAIVPGSAAIATALKAPACARSQSCCRQWNNWLV